MDKIKHHLFLANMALWFTGMILVIALGVIVSLWLLLLEIPLFIAYLFGWWWYDHTELLCPQCGKGMWDRRNYYCSGCGTRLVFRWMVKIKKNEPIPEGRVAIPTCSKGHSVNAYDKFCPKCGEEC